MVWSRKRKTFFLLSGILGGLVVVLANFSPFLSVIAAEPKVIPPITARQAQLLVAPRRVHLPVAIKSLAMPIQCSGDSLARNHRLS